MDEMQSNLKCNILTLTGKGQVTANPDIAVIRLGVETTGLNLAEAQTENAQRMNSVIQALNRMGVTDIKTYQYLIDKVYDYQNGTRIDRGYTVRNIIEIRLTDMASAGYVIDTAVANGANVVDFISFEVSDADLLYRQALNLAVADAIQKAESLMRSLGIRTELFPSRITENSAPPVPYSQFSAAREGVAVTPIQPGNKQIEASVTVEFIY